MYKLEIFDEDNSISLDDEFSTSTLEVSPEIKRFTRRMDITEDVYYRTEIFEYKISNDPIKVSARLIERLDEPPLDKYAVKDGVVLESDIIKNSAMPDGHVMNMTKEMVENLKKEVEWHELWPAGPDALFIISKHPEIISKEEYRKFLRQTAEKLKNAIAKVEQALKKDITGLQIIDGDLGRVLWYANAEKMSESEAEKAREYADKFQQPLFDENSKEYIGIPKHEFQASTEILRNLDIFLDKQEQQNKIQTTATKKSKTKGIIISLLLTICISWVVSWFVDINPFLIFVLVQVVSFIQSIIGGWLERFFE